MMRRLGKLLPFRCMQAGSRYYLDPGTWEWYRAYLWCFPCAVKRWLPWLWKRKVRLAVDKLGARS